MVRSAARVFLRVRPPTASITGNLQFLPDAQFKFDGVLGDASQEMVFETCAKEVLENALQGYNGTVMCYGQTGAGKTYTMTGSKATYEQRGLIPRTLTQLFKEIRNRELERQVQVQVSYLEIYNEQLFDLLDISSQPEDILLHEDARGLVTARGLGMADVSSEMEALRLLFEGESNRVIGEHQLNRESSRSHSIFTIFLMMPTGTDGAAVTAKVNLVDLAGSERVSKTKSEGQVLREAGQINKSLSHLEQVILALSEKGRDHVPYRSSKLTHVLKNSLGGNCKTVLIANVWADQSQLDETLSTCRFAQRMQRISNEVTVNLVQESSARVRQLEREVSELRQELAMHDSLSQRSGVQYTPFTDVQRAALQSQLLGFLTAEEAVDDPMQALGLQTARSIREALLAARQLYRTAMAGAQPMPSSPSGSLSSRTQAVAFDDSGAMMVGDGDEAPAAAAPPEAYSSAGRGGPGSSSGRAMHAGPSDAPPPDRKMAFEDYKMGPGLQKAELLASNRAKLKQVKKKAKDLAVEINGVKRSMDGQKARADELKAARQQRGDDGAQVLEAEEYDALLQLRDLKARYREQYSELQMARSEADYTGQLLEQCTQELLLEFNAWYEDSYGIPGLPDGGAELVGDLNLNGTAGSSSNGSPALESRLGTATSSSSQTSSVSTSVLQRKAPLSSLVRGTSGQDSDADLYYRAQQVLHSKLDGAGHRPGSVKKDRANKGTFSSGPRTNIATAQSPMDLQSLPHRRH